MLFYAEWVTLSGVRRAAGLSEKTGTHHCGADSDETEGDQEVARIVTIAVRSSAIAVIVDWAAA